jgi:hypothetical protein
MKAKNRDFPPQSNNNVFDHFSIMNKRSVSRALSHCHESLLTRTSLLKFVNVFIFLEAIRGSAGERLTLLLFMIEKWSKTLLLL